MQKCPAPVTVRAPADNFTGAVYLDSLFTGDGASHLTAARVRFTPGARTNWHSHSNGQLLHCVDGTGLVATRDGTAITLCAGETVWTPAGQEHWHGGTPDTMMCHLAILDGASTDGPATTWLEPVDDRDYLAAAQGIER